jgi:hypothetical protein
LAFPDWYTRYFLVRSPSRATFIGTEFPDLPEIRPVRRYFKQRATAIIALCEENSLAVGFNPHFPNAAGKGNQPARVHAVFVGNEPVRFTVCCCSIYSQSEFSEDDAPIREDIRILRLDTTQAMRLSRRERNRP